MSDCCRVSGSQGQDVTPRIGTRAKCPQCGASGRTVQRRTVLHHVRSAHLSRVIDGNYRSCANPDCALVYYNENGEYFNVAELREPVSAKTKGNRRPLCYCFGFTEGDIRQEISKTGTSSVPQHITELIRAGMCACEIRNPAGTCCLGPVNEAVRRLLARA